MSEFLSNPYRGPAGGTVRFRKRKSRFTTQEVELLLSEVKKKRHILVGKFNQGISKDLKKRTWASLTARINEISECQREILEVIKKWADLKCDTKRRVAAMRASGASAAQIAQELSPVETMVHQILQMPMPNKNGRTSTNDVGIESEDDAGPSSVPFILPKAPPFHVSIQGKRHLQLPTDVMYSYESAVPLTDLQTKETSGNRDCNMQFIDPGNQQDPNALGIPGFLSHPSAEKSQDPEIPNHSTFNGSSAASIGRFISPSGASSLHSAPVPPPPRPASLDSRRLQEHLTHNASLSLQEQQTTTQLVGSVSRSLESLAESVQKLVHTQQQFSRDTLSLQRDTLHVLRDFSTSALTLLQDKINGRP